MTDVAIRLRLERRIAELEDILRETGQALNASVYELTFFKEKVSAKDARIAELEETNGAYRKFILEMMADKPESSDD